MLTFIVKLQTDTQRATRKRTTRPVVRDWEFLLHERDSGETQMEILLMLEDLPTRKMGMGPSAG